MAKRKDHFDGADTTTGQKSEQSHQHNLPRDHLGFSHGYFRASDKRPGKHKRKVLDFASKKADVKKPAFEAMPKSHKGPIPSSQELGDFEFVQRGLAERIVSMAEEQQKHRFHQESKGLNHLTRQGERGQFYAFVIVILAILGTCILSAMGQEVAGSIIGSTSLVSIVGMFIKGRRPKEDVSE